MEQLIIREATMEDCSGIQNIHRACEDPWNNLEECMAWIGRRLQRGFYIQIARLGDKIVGHGEWLVNDGADGRFLYLGMLQIDDDYQRLGIGRSMIHDGVRYAKDNECPEIVTIPEPDNTSIIFYEKCGFVKRRNIMGCSLETRRSSGNLYKTERLDSVPISILRQKPFIFGLSQASSRHMWEICNHTPSTDDRKTPAIRFEDGDVAQLSYFYGRDSGLVLFWSEQPSIKKIDTILSFGYECNLKKIDFIFFEEYKYFFEDCHIQIDNVEICKSI